jgi:hypothetical protein
MVPDLVSLHQPHAERYIDVQPRITGLLGRRGGWEIKPANVVDYDIMQAKARTEKIRQEALKKLLD